MVALATMAAGKAEMKFDSQNHDFGNISSSGGKVTANYEFTNTGDAPLIIISVSNGGCGCTVPSFPKEPVAPGEKGKISVTFDPTGRSGEFAREVKVRSNSGKRQSLKFSGVIIPSTTHK